MLLQHYVESQHNWWTGSVRGNETVFWWLLKHNVYKEIKRFSPPALFLTSALVSRLSKNRKGKLSFEKFIVSCLKSKMKRVSFCIIL